MNFVHWMRRIHRPTARTHSIGCGWGNAGSSHHSGPPLPSPCPKTDASPLILVAKTIMLLPTHHEIDVAPADCEQEPLAPIRHHRFGTLPRSHLGGLVDLTAAIVVPDDQRQMSRSG